jgi:hypothetical protein
VTRGYLLGLLMLMAVGGFFRFYDLDRQGMYFVDDGNMILDARLWFAAGKLLANDWGLYRSESKEQILHYISERAQSGYSAKPAHFFWRAVGLAAFGDTVGSSDKPVALLGWLTIPVVFFFSRRIFGDDKLALLAAALLALSPSHIQYSRGQRCEADSTLIVLLTVWLCFETARRPSLLQAYRWAWISGLMGGLAFAWNSRWVVIPPMFLATAVSFAVLEKMPFVTAAGLGLRFLCGFALMLVAWELPFHWAMLAARLAGVDLRDIHTFWDGLLVRFRAYGGSCWDWKASTIYLWILCRSEGLTTAFFLSGIVAACRLPQRRLEAFMVVMPVIAGFWFVLYANDKAMVMFSMSLPMIFMLAALGMSSAFRHPVWAKYAGLRAVVAAVVLAAVAGWDVWWDVQSVQQLSHLDVAVRWLRQNHPGDGVLATLYEPAVCEYDNTHVRPLPVPVSLTYLQQARRLGFRFAMIDHQKFCAVLAALPSLPVDDRLLPNSAAFATPSIAAIEASTQPVATFTNQFSRLFFFMYAREHGQALWKSRLFLQCVDPVRDSVIRIYDLDDVLRNLQRKAAPPTVQGN